MIEAKREEASEIRMRVNGEQLEYVRSMVVRGEYRVDSRQVAAAILDRIGAGTGGRASGQRSAVAEMVMTRCGN